jgi:O-antigen/teichoic acid export membrane protein
MATCCDEIESTETAGPGNVLPDQTVATREFDTDHLSADLPGHSVRGGAVTLLTQGGRFITNLLGTAILARLLSPEDFGLLLMIYAMTGFVEMFRDMGLSTATVQVERINHKQLSALFWLNVLLSAALTIIVAAAAPLVSRFYHDSRLTGMTLALSTTFVIGGLATQHRAMLTRQMRFTALGVTDLAGFCVGMVVGIIYALLTRSVWALVIQQIVQYSVTTVTSWMVMRWKPSLPARRAGVDGMLKFGANLAGFNFVNYWARNLDNVLIGRWWGKAVLGLYGKAYQLLMLPIMQISMPFSKVAIPTLSRLQNDPDKYRAYYRKGVMLLAALGMPIVAFLFVAADETIHVFLGPHWDQAIPIFRVLGPAAFFGTFNMATGWVYTSRGDTHRQLRWGILTSAVTVIAFFIAVPHGAIAVGGAFSIVYCTLTMGYPAFAYCFRGTPLRMADMLDAVWRPSVASLGAGVIIFAGLPWLRGHGPAIVSLAIEGFLYAIAYFCLWAVLPGGTDFIRNVVSLARHLRPNRSRQAQGFEVVVKREIEPLSVLS